MPSERQYSVMVCMSRVGNGLALLPAYRTLDHHCATGLTTRPDTDSDTASFNSSSVKPGRPLGQRNQVDVAQALRTVARVLVQVALFLHDGPRFTVAEGADGQVVSKGPCGA